MLKIDSAQNDTFKKYLSLTTSKGLKKEGLFLLSGEKLVREFLLKPKLRIAHEILAPGGAALTEAMPLLLSNELFQQIDVLGTKGNILVIEQPHVAVIENESIGAYEPEGIEVVIPVGDPGNLGALLRSCEAFAVKRVILTQEAAHPFLPKAVKASAGSVLRLTLLKGPPLKSFPDDSVALDMDGTPVNEFAWPTNGLLIVGEEGAGLGTDDATGRPRFAQHVRIPTIGVESLNVVVAASIALAYRVMPRKA